MSGLSLSTGLTARAGSTGNYAPMTPASASTPSAPIANQAYGISGSGASTWPDNTAWVGSLGFGIVSVIGLIYLWWSLPR